MSRHSPTGFVFSLVVEIAAVVVIVSFLPRIDLRPAAAASDSAGHGEPMRGEPMRGEAMSGEGGISHVGWTSPDGQRRAAPPRETSYYERPAGRSFATEPMDSPRVSRDPPPLIVADPSTPGYVEQRLDRASQQLVNSVGTAVAETAGSWLSYSPPPTPAGANAIAPMQPARPSFPTHAVTGTAGRPATAASTAQPRPWIRY